MADLDKLRDEHTVILRIVERLRYLIGQSTPPPQLHVLALRYELSAALIVHLQTEDGFVYPPLLANADPHIVSIGRAFSREMDGLGAAYVEHCKTWSADAIAADWAGYSIASQALLDALTMRISRENRELYPLLRRLDDEGRARAAACNISALGASAGDRAADRKAPARFRNATGR